MSYQLKTDEVLEALLCIEHPSAAFFQQVLEKLTQTMADQLAESLGVECGLASFEGSVFAGTCVAFSPAFEGQPLPSVLAEYDFDSADEWA